MKNKATTTYKWAYLPFVFSSATILATSVNAAPGASQQYQDAKQVSSANYEYVGGKTQVGVGVTDDGDATLDINQVISESQNNSTSVGLWGEYDLKGDDKGFGGRGAQINHNWVSRDKAGRATHVNKVFGAYDRNRDGHDKATVGYGQENENLFWEGHVSKGLSDKIDSGSRTSNGKKIYNQAYDYGVGGSVGTFLPDSNVRVRAGLDHEWGEDYEGESRAKNTTLSAGIEKFFQGTPHSLGLDVAASKRSGGYESNNDNDDVDVSGKLSYRYDFGGASIYQPDKRYRRVRVEVPGQAVPPRYAKKAQFKRVQTYKSVPVFGNKTVRTPYKQLVKSTMELEGQTFFKLNSARIIPSAQTRLKQIASQIRKNGYKGSIRITGNTCGLGNAKYDQILSEKRANAVKRFLIANGFDAKRLVARGLGKGSPKYPNTPDQGFKNRRVDIEYVSERKSYKTGYKTEQKRVQTGTRKVATGFKNVPAGFKNVMIDSGRAGAPRVIWKTEAIATSPAWVTRALHNNIKHNTNVNTYQTLAEGATTPENMGPTAVNDTSTIQCNNGPVTIDVLGNDSDPENDNLTIANVTNGQFGTTEVVNGQVVYTPNPGTAGCGLTDSFQYTVSDGNGNTSTANVNVIINEDNQAPIAVDDSVTTEQGQLVVLNTLENDSDPEGDTLTITSVQNPANGVAEIVGGQIVYTPNADFVGTETFNYTISDGQGNTATATETIVVTAPVDDNVNAADDLASTNEGSSVTIDVLNNDDTDASITRIVANPSSGTASINNGQIVYTPNAGFSGTDTFSYEVKDPAGNLATADVTVTVNAVAPANVAPIALNDSATTGQGEAVTLTTLSNDSDADGDTLTITDIQSPANGTAVISADGQGIIYTPDAGFIGTDRFTYTISDGNGNSAMATETVVVTEGTPANVAPIALNDSATTGQGQAVTLTTLSNDSDADGDTLTITDIQNPTNGTAVISADGQGIVYTPNAGFTGTDRFTYTISDGNGNSAMATETVVVTEEEPKNVAPIALNDSATTGQGEAVTLTTLSNDSDADGDTLTITDIQNPTNGTAVISADGQGIVYTPDAGFTGTDRFTYTISDGNGNSAMATETVVVTEGTPANVAPIAKNDTGTTPIGHPVTLSTLSNDSDADGDTLTIVDIQDPANGTAVISADGQGIVYTPNPDFAGVERFTYTISDGNGNTAQAVEIVTVTGRIVPANTAPIARNDSATTEQGESVTLTTLSNDADVDGDTLTITSIQSPANGTAVVSSDGQGIVYTPNAGFIGTDRFTYVISDGNGGTATATETVIVRDSSVKASDDSRMTDMDTSVTIDVLDNDDSDASINRIVSNPGNGSASIVNGRIVYTPNAGFTGTDSFVYEVKDAAGNTDQATVTVTVKDTRVDAKDDAKTTDMNTSVTIDVLDNDDSDASINRIVSNPGNGSASIVNGRIVYTPNSGFTGTDSFVYEVRDAAGNTDQATVTVTVRDSKVDAKDDAKTTDMNTSVTIDVLDNDDSDASIKRIVSNPSKGSAQIVNGRIVYTPNAGFTGTDSFVYEVEDAAGNTDQATVTVTVKDTEVKAADDYADTNEGDSVVINVLSNDDSDATFTGQLTQPSNGSAQIVNGEIVYTPNAGFSGLDSFNYEVTDPEGNKTMATVFVTVNDVNKVPNASNDTATTTCSAITINVLDNDNDPDGDALSIINVSGASLGTAVASGGQIIYTPSNTCGKGSTGIDSFTYTISDGNNGTDTATVTVDVTGDSSGGSNVKAEPDDASTLMDQPIRINVLSNDAGKGLSISDVSMPMNGTAKIVGKTIKYIPAQGFTGTDSFWYDVVDEHGNKDSALILVYVEKSWK